MMGMGRRSIGRLNGEGLAHDQSPPAEGEGSEHLDFQPGVERSREEDPVGHLQQGDLPGSPLILQRSEHNISRRSIDADAIKVMGRLLRHGYRAFLVGGGVRDLLLGKTPKDFDIGTDATPEVVRSLFRNSRLIGRRFRIVHIYFGGNKIFEISTFRSTSEDDVPASEEGSVGASPKRGDNTWGDPETDARRRDLTINGLFYDLSNFSVIDYVGGIADLRAQTIRVIGDPDQRFAEDPVRMIRAVRHAARTGFTIEPRSYDSIVKNAALIAKASPARVFEELTRELRGGAALASISLLRETGLLTYLLPPLAEALDEHGSLSWDLLSTVLQNLDAASAAGVEIPLATIFLALFIGQLPDDCMDDLFKGAAKEIFHAVWRPVPLMDEQISELAEDCEESDDVQRTAEPSRRQYTVIAEKSSERLFRPLGVPRRERERMRQLLSARIEIVQAFLSQTPPRALMGRSYFEEALILLRLTPHAPIIPDCLDWIDNTFVEKQSRRPRRRSHRVR